MMNLKNTLFLFVLFAALGIYIYFVEFKQYEKEEEAKADTKKLFSVVKDSVESFSFRNFNGHFTVKIIQNQWKITDPVYTEADESTINSMLSSLIDAQKEAEFDILPDERSNFGLGERAIFVELQDKSGLADSVRMGDKAPVGSFVFANKSDSSVFTINQSVKSSFEKKLFDIRYKNYLQFKRADVRKIVLKNKFGLIEFEKSGSTNWHIVNTNRLADNGKVNSILTKLGSNKTKEFVNETGQDLEKYGLKNPAFKVSLILGPDQEQKELILSKKLNGKYYARDETRKPIFEVDSALVKDINRPTQDFRGKDMITFTRGDIVRVSVSYSDTTFSCVKDSSDNWFLDDSSRQSVKTQKMNTFFSNLDYTNVVEFVVDGKYNPALYGLDSPVVEVTLYDENGKVLQVKLGSKKENNIYATTDQYESVYLIPQRKIEELKLRLDEILEEPVTMADEIPAS
ncbi:MAG: DUF4340 domain-containing protein [Calditrichae bacterium]|nr:DUF4340 domain-containing protein [Calditrichia bacterium]